MPTAAERWAIAVTGAFGAQASILVLMHLLPTGHDPTVHFASEYVIGPWGWLMRVGAIFAIVGAIALVGLVRAGAVARLGSVLGGILLLNVLARIVGAVFTVDPVGEAFSGGGAPDFSATGWAHVIAGMVGAWTLMIAMAWITVRLRRWEARPPGYVALVVFSVAAPLARAAMMASRPATFPAGLLQRLFIAATLGWLLTFGIGMAARAPTLADDDGPQP